MNNEKRYIHMLFLLAIALMLSMLLYNMPVFAAGLEVEIGSSQGSAGETVRIPVSFKNVPAAGVNSCDFVISYDTGVLEVAEDGITAGPVTRNASETFDFNIDAGNGRVKFLFSDETGAGGEAIKSDGVFADIKFIIKQNAAVGFSEVKTKGEWAFGNTGLEYIETKIKNRKVEVIEKQGYKVSGYIIPDFSFGNQAATVLKSGFNVEIVGTETSTVTDQNGFFELNAPEGMTDCTLKIKKSGFLLREIKNILVREPTYINKGAFNISTGKFCCFFNQNV